MSDQPDTGTQPTIKLNDVEVEGIEAASNSAEPSEPSHTATAGRRRQKVPLAPGHTLAHWNALVQQRRHIPPAVKITPSMLAEHKTQQDAWVSINGKVFDVTRYMDYHPGGVAKLMLVAGKDATSMFYKYHAWVNYESLLAADCVGYLVPGEEDQ